MEENKNYWNEFGLLRGYSHENDQNGLLRLAYYYLFDDGIIDRPHHRENALDALEKMNYYGYYSQHPECTPEQDPASHDEMTAVLYFYSAHCRYTKINGIRTLPYLKYIQFFPYLKSIQTENKFLVWLSGFIIYQGVKDVEMAKNGKLDTDSELLALLKLKTYENLGIRQPWEYKIMKVIRHNWGNNYEKKLIGVMLEDPAHPLRVLVDKGGV